MSFIATAEPSKVIWRFSDGRAGHDAQSTGLVSALSEIISCECHDVLTPFDLSCYPRALLKRLPELEHLPRPHLLVGAGHATHLPMLASRFVLGGRIVVIMKPSLPACCFDLCLVPEHDQFRAAENIISTVGPLNNIRRQSKLVPGRGLILIGGPSKHFIWDDSQLQDQLNVIVEKGGQWLLSDSPRTPQSMREILKALENDNLQYCPFEQHPVSQLLEKASSVWVSEDSMSMIYEALSSGAAVGVLALEARSRSRLSGVAASLSEKNLLTSYEDWLVTGQLNRPAQALQESSRAASSIVARLGWQGQHNRKC